MKIKLAILDSDKNYLGRLSSVFTSKYFEKIEVYSFSDQEVALSSLSANRVDVFICDKSFVIDVDRIPKRCGFAYLVDSFNIESVYGIRAICKFQKVDMIYKEVLGIFSENASGSTGLVFDGSGEVNTITFTSFSGGVGCSTLAVACAKRLARRGKKVLYLNLEKFGNTDYFFNGEGQFTFSDVIYAIKSKRANLALKLESYVKTDVSGVYFFSASKTALDVMEMTDEDIKDLLNAIKFMGTYDYLIIDMGFEFSSSCMEVFNASGAIVSVSDCSEIANEKFMRACKAMEIYEQQKDVSVMSKIVLMYNRVSSKTGKVLNEIGLKSLGGVGIIAQATPNQIIDHLAEKEIFDELMG